MKATPPKGLSTAARIGLGGLLVCLAGMAAALLSPLWVLVVSVGLVLMGLAVGLGDPWE